MAILFNNGYIVQGLSTYDNSTWLDLVCYGEYADAYANVCKRLDGGLTGSGTYRVIERSEIVVISGDDYNRLKQENNRK